MEAMGLATALGGRRVLVTGHTGFKGSWLGLWLSQLGAEVFGVALPPPELGHFSLCKMEHRVTHRSIDIRDRAGVRDAFSAFSPEIVFHLAAQPLVRTSYESPAETFDVNVGGTVSVLEAARSCGTVRAVVIVTSDKCYENREWDHAYREEDALGGHDPYSASKAATEIVSQAYRRSFFSGTGVEPRARIATARAGNVIGGGDWSCDRLIPDCVRALTAKEAIQLRNPYSVRPWQHVLEPLHGYLLLGAALLHGRDLPGAFNFGPLAHDAVTVEEIARHFAGRWGTPDLISTAPAATRQLHEAGVLKLASDRAVARLGWRPRLNVLDAVRWTADWYAVWRDGNSSGLFDLSAQQVRAYEQLCAQA